MNVQMQSLAEVPDNIKRKLEEDAIRLMRWEEGKKRHCKCTNLAFATRREFHRHHIAFHTTRVS